MKLDEAIYGRRSIRKYIDKPVSREDIMEIVKAGIAAPSWRNSQVSRYYVVDDKEGRAAFTECMAGFNVPRTENAGAIIVTTVVDGFSGYTDNGDYATHLGIGFETFDNGLQVQNMLLKAYELGLGTLIMGLYDEKKVREFFGIPEDQIIVTLIAVGYTEDKPMMPHRNNPENVVSFYSK